MQRRPSRRQAALIVALHNAGATTAAALILWGATHAPPLTATADDQLPFIGLASELVDMPPVASAMLPPGQ